MDTPCTPASTSQQRGPYLERDGIGKLGWFDYALAMAAEQHGSTRCAISQCLAELYGAGSTGTRVWHGRSSLGLRARATTKYGSTHCG